MTSDDIKIKNGSNTVEYKSSLISQIALLYSIDACFGLIERHCKIVFARKYREESSLLFSPLENKRYFTIVFQKCFEISAPPPLFGT
jgi:hypothetical protein